MIKHVYKRDVKSVTSKLFECGDIQEISYLSGDLVQLNIDSWYYYLTGLSS